MQHGAFLEHCQFNDETASDLFGYPFLHRCRVSSRSVAPVLAEPSGDGLRRLPDVPQLAITRRGQTVDGGEFHSFCKTSRKLYSLPSLRTSFTNKSQLPISCIDVVMSSGTKSCLWSGFAPSVPMLGYRSRCGRYRHRCPPTLIRDHQAASVAR